MIFRMGIKWLQIIPYTKQYFNFKSTALFRVKAKALIAFSGMNMTNLRRCGNYISISNLHGLNRNNTLHHQPKAYK